MCAIQSQIKCRINHKKIKHPLRNPKPILRPEPIDERHQRLANYGVVHNDEITEKPTHVTMLSTIPAIPESDRTVDTASQT